MTIEGVIKCLPELEKLSKLKSLSKRKVILKRAKSCLFYAISEIAKNTITGNIPLNQKQKNKLYIHRRQLREISRKSGVSLKRKKLIINQKGGAFLPALLIPAVSYLVEKYMKK